MDNLLAARSLVAMSLAVPREDPRGSTGHTENGFYVIYALSPLAWPRS